MEVCWIDEKINEYVAYREFKKYSKIPQNLLQVKSK